MAWWRTAAALAARDGVIVGLVGTAAFFVLHAPIVHPIWDAWPRGLLLGPLNGAIAGLLYYRMRRERRFRHPLGGMLLGALAGLTLAPFAIVGWMRSRGAPDPFWLLILALLVTSLYHVTQAVQDEQGRLRRWELLLGLLAMNALPIYFLTFISDFHDGLPDPVPMTLAVAAIYVGAGAGLTRLAEGNPAMGRRP